MANINKIKLSGTSYDIQDSNAARSITLTQAEYDGLQNKDPNVFYIISDSNVGYITSAETESAITQAVSGKADTNNTVQSVGLSTLADGKSITAVIPSGTTYTATIFKVGNGLTWQAYNSTIVVDTSKIAQKTDIPTSNSGLTNDAGYATSGYVDSAVSGKANSSDVYTKSQTSGATEISTALNDKLDATAYTPTDLSNYYTTAQTNTKISQAVSGKTNQSDFSGHTANTTVHVTAQDKTNWNNKSDFSGSYNDLTDKPTIPTVPTSNTAFTNDAGYITSSALNGYATTGDVQTATNDMATKTWVGQQGYLTEHQSLTAYSTTEQVNTAISQATSGKTNNTDFAGHTANTTVHVTAQDKTNWNAKSDFSGSYNDLTDKPTIPTVPTSNTAFTNDAGYITDSALEDYATESYVTNGLDGKQDTLESGVNIKTVNNYSLLGSGNINIGGSGGNNVVELTQAEYDALDPKDPSAFYIITDAEGGDLANYMTSAQTTSAIAQAVSGKTDNSDFTGHTADTTVHVTSTEKAAWNAKSDFSGSYNDLTNKLSAGTNITIVDNVISAEGGGSITIDPSLNTGSTNAVANSAITTAINAKQDSSKLPTYIVSDWNYDKSTHKVSVGKILKTNGGAMNITHSVITINNQGIFDNTGVSNLNLVETSAITTSITSSSTDSQVPSAKAVNDKLGGLSLVKLSQSEYDSLATKDNSTLYVIVN